MIGHQYSVIPQPPPQSHIPSDEDLPTFPLDPTYLAPLRARVRLAKQILSVVQKGKRVRQGNEWTVQTARAMEIEVDEDMYP